MAPFAAFIALDCSAAKQAGWLLAVAPGKTESGHLTPTPEALAAWATALRTRFAGQPVAVCLEQARSPLI